LVRSNASGGQASPESTGARPPPPSAGRPTTRTSTPRPPIFKTYSERLRAGRPTTRTSTPRSYTDPRGDRPVTATPNRSNKTRPRRRSTRGVRTTTRTSVRTAEPTFAGSRC
jgi:hypothetical protein